MPLGFSTAFVDTYADRQDSRLPRWEDVNGVEETIVIGDDDDSPELTGASSCSPDDPNLSVCCPEIFRLFSLGRLVNSREKRKLAWLTRNFARVYWPQPFML